MYPGTFDPVTNGHLDLVRRVSRLYEKVIIAVASSPSKAPVFSFEERVELMRAATSDLSNVIVDGYDGLTVSYAKENGLAVIIRGLRALTDFEHEFQLAKMNRHLDPDIETIFLSPNDEYTFISSSLVKEVAMMGGDVSHFVQPEVARLLRERCKGA
jgi:pantetheine-phosphate adenylyltransferase